MNQNLYVDIHIIQTVPPSCVNRDDTGSPKTATYGGVNRARVSSQAWKHATREAMRRYYPEQHIGVRTKGIVELLMNAIMKLAPEKINDPDATKKMAIEALGFAGISIKEKDGKSDSMVFVSHEQINALAAVALADEKSVEDYKLTLMDQHSIDIAMFGRMVASTRDLDCDASVQVAHAISTHAVRNEYDFFTAVDDCSTSGAGHLDVAEFNSSTLYRYATINVRTLYENLGEQAADAVVAFLDTFTTSMPTGKQNSFANRTLPDAVYITVRRDQPVNMVGAFEAAVTSKDGYANKSVSRLVEYAQGVYASFADVPAAGWTVGTQKMLEELAPRRTFKAVLEEVRNVVTEGLKEVE